MDGQPWVAGNVYLRQMAPLKNWSDATLSRKATCFRHLAQWLSDEGRSFWDPEVRLGGRLMVDFRNSLFEKRPDSDYSGVGSLQAVTIRRIMAEAYGLCSFWKANDEKIKGERQIRGSWRGRKAIPPAYSVRVVAPSRRGQQSLTLEEVRSIWRYLYVECRPPRRWGNGVRRQEWQWLMSFWARDCMIWALLISTGLRRGEVPGLMIHDVKNHKGAGWWVHLIDPREQLAGKVNRVRVSEYGATFKTGSRDIIVWFQDWFDSAFTNWVSWRPFLVALTGAVDHEMLLVSKQGNGTKVGSPLTYWGLSQFFKKVNKALGPFSGDSGGEPFYITAHTIRHTLESILRSRNVPLFFRQATLGHRRPDTTLAYGTTYRTSLIAAQKSFGASFTDEFGSE